MEIYKTVPSEDWFDYLPQLCPFLGHKITESSLNSDWHK